MVHIYLFVLTIIFKSWGLEWKSYRRANHYYYYYYLLELESINSFLLCLVFISYLLLRWLSSTRKLIIKVTIKAITIIGGITFIIVTALFHWTTRWSIASSCKQSISSSDMLLYEESDESSIHTSSYLSQRQCLNCCCRCCTNFHHHLPQKLMHPHYWLKIKVINWFRECCEY